MRIPGALLTVLIILFHQTCCCVADTGQNNIEVIPGIPGYTISFSSGSMPVRAIKTVLEYHDIHVSLPVLMAVSGKSFVFVYDNRDTREYQRDLYPVDYYENICRFQGLAGEWIVNRDKETLLPVIMRNISSKTPMIAPKIVPGGYHGYYIVAGYNHETDTILVREASIEQKNTHTKPDYRSCRLPDNWQGPVTTADRWVKNPVYCLTVPDNRTLPREKHWIKSTLETALHVLQITEASYGTNTALSGNAAHGLLAYDTCESEIRALDSGIGFEQIWRLDAQLSQLADSREMAGRFFQEIVFLLPADAHEYCSTLAETNLALSRHAATLQKMFWHHVTATKAEAIIPELKNMKAMVYSVDTDENTMKKILGAVKGKWMDTEWGSCIFVNVPDSKNRALEHIRKMKQFEKDNIRTLHLLIDSLKN